jgi:SAM-dependent methyltransferase
MNHPVNTTDTAENQKLIAIIEKNIIRATFSKPAKNSCPMDKIRLSQIYEDPANTERSPETARAESRDKKIYFQIESYKNNQVFHRNIPEHELKAYVLENYYLFRELFILCSENEYSIKISKKGKLHITGRAVSKLVSPGPHNRKKDHILADGNPVDFLIRLGIMDNTGRVRHKWYDKFKQINRYLELIEDSLKHLDTINPLIIDFGCGKSYLTFALYYYLNKIKGLSAKIIGLDLKEEVIKDLNILAKDLNYTSLEFHVGNIADYTFSGKLDMVISLHACNTATDHAIARAIKWKTKVIMAVPCCHKEANSQIDISPMKSIMSYGVLKERIAALMTDGLRAELLKIAGYETQVIEFIDMQHTPKNLMIRAYLKCSNPKITDIVKNDYLKCCEKFDLDLTLHKLLKDLF